ncbi:hypothetical protein ACFW1A_01285 [Kitasatospora sp. NPDC058965]|uniref:hypothetical protein n=1 Tax=Kitasatospora sp. NPDC058965 TaxID=3346682 RepID=UPI0036BEE022
MRITGWNHLVDVQSLPLRIHDYPIWLRVWMHLPLVERFAHPHVVRINATLPPDRTVMATAFSYAPSRAGAKKRTLYRNRPIQHPGID